MSKNETYNRFIFAVKLYCRLAAVNIMVDNGTPAVMNQPNQLYSCKLNRIFRVEIMRSYAMFPNACSRSEIKSSTFSRPIFSRTMRPAKS